MQSFKSILDYIDESDVTLIEAILEIEANHLDCHTSEVYDSMASRLADMKRSVDEACRGTWVTKIVEDDASKMREYRLIGNCLSGELISRASEIALSVSTCNAAMGRIVAAPTAGSCGILPGLLFSWDEYRGKGEKDLTEGLIVAAAVGQIIANRATLAGAEGGCQAECGAAIAMGSAALVWLEGGDAKSCFEAATISIKSITGLVCDPVAGLVEVPCIKRNGSLVGLAVLASDMALAGISSVIPPDEIVDAMYEVGRALPASLRETGRGGVANTQTGRTIAAQLRKDAPTLEG